MGTRTRLLTMSLFCAPRISWGGDAASADGLICEYGMVVQETAVEGLKLLEIEFRAAA